MVTLTAQKEREGLRAGLKAATPARLGREGADRALRELWVFPVAPETCNLSCTHCLYAASPRTRNPYRLSSDDLSSLLSQVKRTGARPHFLFTGGEPTMHPRLYDLLRTVDSNGYSFQLMTNGTRIQEETAKLLSGMTHLTKVQISLESPDHKINDSIYGAGLHGRALKAVDNLREQGVPVTLAVTPMDVNEEGLSEIETLASARDAEVKYISLYDLGAARENGLKPAESSSSVDAAESPVELMCDKGVAYSEGSFYPCPVLVKEPGTRLGTTLEEALSPQSRNRVERLREVHAACQVCLKGST